MSFEVILPFLRPIAHLMQDPDVSEIMVNGGAQVFVERHGRITSVPDVRLDERNLQVAVKNIARALGDDVNDEQPVLDSRLPDGSRVAAILAPCSIGGTTLTIRRFQSRFYTADELIRVGTVTAETLAWLQTAVERRQTILISGGTSTGKTTLLNVLAGFLPTEDRVILLEDTAELRLQQPNLVRLEARRAGPGRPAITVRDLLKATLRHRPDRIIVGEVRGGEAYDLLQAFNSGHDGSLTTIHASSAVQALARFAAYVAQSGIDLPYAAIRRQVGASLPVVVHLERRGGGRVVDTVLRVGGYDDTRDEYQAEAVR